MEPVYLNSPLMLYLYVQVDVLAEDVVIVTILEQNFLPTNSLCSAVLPG